MENNISAGDLNEPRAAADLLDELQADRQRLARRAEAPRWLAPAFGLLAGLYVAAPALPGDPRSGVFVTMGIILGIVLVFLSSRATGVKFSNLGLQGWAAFTGAVAGGLLFFSVSLGLVSLGLHWWVIVPAAATFALVLWLTRVMSSSMRKNLSSDR
jgi:hypothetical protein